MSLDSNKTYPDSQQTAHPQNPSESVPEHLEFFHPLRKKI